MQIHTEERSNRIIVRFAGKLNDDTCEDLRKNIEPLIVGGGGCLLVPVVLDMAEVEELTDDALMVLELLKEKAAACLDTEPSSSDLLRIINPSAAVREALRNANLLDTFTGWRDNLCKLPGARSTGERFQDVLVEVRNNFPSPTPDPFRDAYLNQSILRGLDAINKFKQCDPLMRGEAPALDYNRARKARLEEDIRSSEEVLEELAQYFEGMPLWGHEMVQPNVIPPATIPSVVGYLFATLFNPNIIWDEYSHRISEAEVEATAICANLLGYDPEQAAGIFTWGGTGTNFYGLRLGIEKALPGAFENGVREDVKLISSTASHYCKFNALGWLGVGTKNLITIPVDDDNAMHMDKLEQAMRQTLDAGEKIACIVPTVGTTDSFGLDNVERIYDLRERLTQEYKLNYRPHIHADAVIGWAWAVFNDYHFSQNPMRFPARTLRSLRDVQSVVSKISLADSVGLDFHKTGYAPYLSSLFITKDKTDLDSIARDRAKMPYLFQFGNYHPGMFTMESSRGGGAVLAALANLKFLGKEGYRALLGYTTSVAEALRMRLEQSTYATVVNDHNHGPVTLFRIYPSGINAAAQWRNELTNAEYDSQLRTHNEYNRKIFDALHQKVLGGECLELSLTENYRDSVSGTPILALKSYIMSPFVEEESMVELIRCIETVRHELGS